MAKLEYEVKAKTRLTLWFYLAVFLSRLSMHKLARLLNRKTACWMTCGNRVTQIKVSEIL